MKINWVYVYGSNDQTDTLIQIVEGLDFSKIEAGKLGEFFRQIF
jgi:hypothetical protein